MQQMWGHWYKHHQMGEKGIVLMVRDGRPRKHEYAESYPLHKTETKTPRLQI